MAATSGAMGGSVSEEFLAPTPVGEDTYANCSRCGYAANVEAVTTPAPPAGDPDAHPPAEAYDTPETPIIDSLVALANAWRLGGRDGWTAADALKNVVLTLDRPGASGLRVLVDDRAQVSVGVKFTDAELIGIPRTVVVGRRIGEGYVELRDRRTDERVDVPLAGLVERLSDSQLCAPATGP